MVDEERECLNLKAESPDHSTDEDVIIDDGYDDTDDMDADGDHEFIPGCYELDISPNPVSAIEIWIRAGHIRVYKYTESKYDLCYKRRMAHQPGTGKSVYVLYMLPRPCAGKKPIIWSSGRGCFIFVGHGVYQMAQGFEINESNIFVRALVDLDQA